MGEKIWCQGLRRLKNSEKTKVSGTKSEEESGVRRGGSSGPWVGPCTFVTACECVTGAVESPGECEAEERSVPLRKLTQAGGSAESSKRVAAGF